MTFGSKFKNACRMTNTIYLWPSSGLSPGKSPLVYI